MFPQEKRAGRRKKEIANLTLEMKLLNNALNRIERAGDGTIYAIFFLICLSLYFRALFNGYSLDDDYILSDANVQAGVGSLKEIFTSRYITYYHTNYEYRPVAKLFFALEYQWFGMKPAAAHFVSVLLYFFIGVLLYKLLRQLKFVPGKAFAVLSVLLFLIHPLHTEAVCSIKNTDVLLCGLFSVSAALVAVKGMNRNKMYYLGFSFALLLIALLSKLDALTFCALIPALIFLNDRTKLRTAIVLAAGFAFIYFAFMKGRKMALSGEEDAVLRRMAFHENPLVGVTDLKIKLAAIFASLGFYIEKILIPVPMSSYYGFNTLAIHEPLTQRWFFMGLAAAAIILFSLWYYRKNSLVIAGILFFFIPISMFLNFPKLAPGIVADRFAFTGIFGFCILLSFAVNRVQTESQPINRIAKITFILILFIFPVLTIARSLKWKSHLSLVENDLQNYPNSAMLHFLKGSFLMKEADNNYGMGRQYLDSSLSSFKRSLEIYSGNSSAWNNIGGIYFFRYKYFDSAYAAFKKAYELDPHEDNKVLYAKSAFLSGHKKEFALFAVKEINSGKGEGIKTFLREFPRFLPADTINLTFNLMIESGLSEKNTLLEIGNYFRKTGDTRRSALALYLAFKNGHRDNALAEELAEYFYDEGQTEKASYLMDITEGKIK